MGKTYESMPEHVMNWIQKQHMFFVASAPLKADGHVNMSPKGYADTFHVVNDRQVWYEDLSGSGVETIAHLKENGRITIAFIAFNGAPNIVRLFGTGKVHEFGSPEYDTLIPPENRKPGTRAAIVIDIYKVTTACGFGVPLYTYERDRPTSIESNTKLEKWECTGEKKGIKTAWRELNATSIDGLPGLEVALHTDKQFAEPKELPHTPFKPSASKANSNQEPSTAVGDGLRKGLSLGFLVGAVVAAVACKVMELR